jgi:hypothetical protein
MNPQEHNLRLAKERLRAELKKLGFTDVGIAAISKHVATYTAAAVRLDRSKRMRDLTPNQTMVALADVVINGRPAPRG